MILNPVAKRFLLLIVCVFTIKVLITSSQTSCDQFPNTIIQIANDISHDSILYNSGPLSDCSGIYHQLSNRLVQHCKDVEIPDPKIYRSSSEIGFWYLKKGDLTLINDPIRQSNLIRPGTIMFYGRRTNSKNIHKNIHHIGIVIRVNNDQDGKVSDYSLFHGRSEGKYAGITTFHTCISEPDSKLPPCGNGYQDWLAMAKFK